MPFVDYPFNFERPIIFIKVKNPINDVELDVLALVDTGADSCMFPASLAAALSIDLKKTTHIGSTKGVENIAQTTYAHRCVISLLSPKDRKTIIKTMPECLVEFSEKEIPLLLGTQNFLKYFTLTITYSNKNTRFVY